MYTCVTNRGLTREFKMVGLTNTSLSLAEKVAYIYTEKEQKYGRTITKVQWAQEYNRGLATPHTAKNKDEASYKSTPN